MKTTLLSSMGSFVLGTGVTLVALASWTGTTDLQAIKDRVIDYMAESEQHAFALVEDYNVTVDQANAEIGEYKDALAQANSNIDKLITAYENKVDEMELAQAQAEQDLADLQAELDNLYARMDSQYETDMNEVIEQANAEINQANTEVAETKEQIISDLETSLIDEIVNGEKNQLDTTGDKSVQDISSVVPQEQPAE